MKLKLAFLICAALLSATVRADPAGDQMNDIKLPPPTLPRTTPLRLCFPPAIAYVGAIGRYEALVRHDDTKRAVFRMRVVEVMSKEKQEAERDAQIAATVLVPLLTLGRVVHIPGGCKDGRVPVHVLPIPGQPAPWMYLPESSEPQVGLDDLWGGDLNYTRETPQ